MKKKMKLGKVPPRIELGLLDSESNVLTARPWDLAIINILTLMYLNKLIFIFKSMFLHEDIRFPLLLKCNQKC